MPLNAKRPVPRKAERDVSILQLIIILLAPGTVHYLSSITVPFLCSGLPL